MAHSNITLTCPACGSVNSLEAMCAHDDGVRAVVAALSLGGSLGKLVVQYLGCFKPAKSRLTAEKQARILEELVPLINQAMFVRHGSHVTAPRDLWEAGIAAVLEQARQKTIVLPLKKHGYLFEVMYKMVEQQSARAEAKTEAHKAHAGQVRRFDERNERVDAVDAVASNDAADNAKHTLPTPEQAAAIKKSIAAIAKRMGGV